MKPAGRRFVTQQAVADAAGVHYSTVSLALRDNPRIPGATRERVKSVARRLGYAADPLVSLLMARIRQGDASYQGTLAYVHAGLAGPCKDNIVYRNFLAGAIRRAGELGYKLGEFQLPTDRRAAAGITRTLQANHVDGVIVEHVPGAGCSDRCLPFDVSPFAAVSIGVPVARPSLHYVANDQYMRPVLAVRELLALGYRRPGLVMWEPFDVNMTHRCSAGFWAVQKHVRQLEVIPILRLTAGDKAGAIRRWLKRHRPDVVLGPWLQILDLLRDAGARVPDDIGWVHLDWTPEFARSTGVYGNSEHTGAAAVEMVISQLYCGERGSPVRPASYLISGTWMKGRTVRRVGPGLNFAQTSFFPKIFDPAAERSRDWPPTNGQAAPDLSRRCAEPAVEPAARLPFDRCQPTAARRSLTLRSVADAAAVHYSTVSLALRNDPRLPDATRQRIRSVARSLGYAPNPLFSLLMARTRRGDAEHRGTLAFVRSDPAEGRDTNNIRQNFLAGAARRAGALGYKLDAFDMPKELGAAGGMTRMLEARGITGVIVEHFPSSVSPDGRLPFDLSPFASVSIGVPVTHPPLHYVANDQYMRPILAVRELLALGYRRPGLVMEELFDACMARRCSAGFWAIQQYVAQLEVIPILHLAGTDKAAVIRRWIRRYRPDVIMTPRHWLFDVIREEGFEVPRDIGYINLAWRPEFAPATGVSGNSEEIGAAAVDSVVSQLHRGERGLPVRPASYLISGSWIEGRTIRHVGPAVDFDQAFFAELLNRPPAYPPHAV